MGAGISKCRSCGKFIAQDGYCYDCYAIVEAEYRKVKDYVYAHPGANIAEAARNTGVGEKRIFRFIKEGRLDLFVDSAAPLECEVCRARISSGKYCSRCSADFIKALEKSGKQQPPAREKDPVDPSDRKAKMHLNYDIKFS